MINNRYRIDAEIGKGSFASVFIGTDTKTQIKVAIKLVEIRQYTNSTEGRAFEALSGLPHFPVLYWRGKYENFYCFVMELLGNSLMVYLQTHNITLPQICEIGIQLTNALEIMHNHNFLHRDIKPENIATALATEESYYLIDYGLSRLYLDNVTKQHAPLRENVDFRGNLVFCSRNTLSGITSSRRDDIESLNLLIIYLVKKELPWLAQRENMSKMIARRSIIALDQLTQDLPEELIEISKYSQSLSYYQKPNYQWLIDCFEKCKYVCTNKIPKIKLKKSQKKHSKRSKTAHHKGKFHKYQTCETLIAPLPELTVALREKLRNTVN